MLLAAQQEYTKLTNITPIIHDTCTRFIPTLHLSAPCADLNESVQFQNLLHFVITICISFFMTLHSRHVSIKKSQI